jgi:sortase A
VNLDRSKNSQFVPPPFGSSAANTPGTGEALTPYLMDAALRYSSAGGSLSVGGGSSANGSAGGNTGGVLLPPSDGNTSSAPPFTPVTSDLYYSDGSLGSLQISAIGLSVKVYEGESLTSIAKGAGHFTFTSLWDGNVGFAGHNRGQAYWFGDIHTLRYGDRIVYSTKLGTRNYSVYYVGRIHETDFSRLERTNENIVTLITCVRDEPAYRWCVQAVEG